MPKTAPEQQTQRSQEEPSGYNLASVDIAQVPLSSEGLVSLNRHDIKSGVITPGGTEIVLQRHGQYVRDAESEEAGRLTEEGEKLEAANAASYFADLLNGMPDEERKNVHFLFVSSDTAYADKGMRSYETATVAQETAEQILDVYDIPRDNILNNSHNLKAQGNPRPMSRLREPQIFDNSQDFVDFMRSKYGDMGKDFWMAFEEDTEKDTREAMGAEGPDEIADRTKTALKVLSRYASLFHDANPGSRLVIWASTHHDTISPFIKRDVLHQDKSFPVLVDYGGGAVIDIDKSGAATARVKGRDYDVSF